VLLTVICKADAQNIVEAVAHISELIAGGTTKLPDLGGMVVKRFPQLRTGWPSFRAFVETRDEFEVHKVRLSGKCCGLFLTPRWPRKRSELTSMSLCGTTGLFFTVSKEHILTARKYQKEQHRVCCIGSR
jgi:hypothetical protein